MGITKLMHMKEGKGTPHAHLKNAIDYILKPEKTKDGLLIGGNCGSEPEEVLQAFLETKKEFGKMDGRQGYHFVISFAKGETDEKTAYEVIQDFCREYLGDSYDYVFAVHDDKEHLHGHIVFNSIDRVEGYKYRYQKGDWEKTIQPVTDRVCEAHGLAPLTYSEDRVGISYAEWKAKINEKDIAKADMDYAIAKSTSMEEFYRTLERMGYRIIRKGTRRSGEEYFSFQFPGAKGAGKRNRRNTSLGKPYGVEAIRSRIASRNFLDSYEGLSERMLEQAKGYIKPMATFRSKSHTRLYQAVSYYKLPNPYAVPAWRVRSDMKRLEKLVEQCSYLQRNGFRSAEEVTSRLSQVKEQIVILRAERKTMYRIQDIARDGEGKKIFARYQFLRSQLQRKDLPDALWEQFAQEKEMLSSQHPESFFDACKHIEAKTKAIRNLQEEVRIMEGILQTEAEGQDLGAPTERERAMQLDGKEAKKIGRV